MSSFVCVGNAVQPFTRLLDAVDRLAMKLPQPVVVQFGAAENWEGINCEGVDFLGMHEFEKHAEESLVTIMHAGAGSIIHALQAGKVPVIVPRRFSNGEHVDDHQVEFCRQLANELRVVVCEDIADLEESVTIAMHRQNEITKDSRDIKMLDLLGNVFKQHTNKYSHEES